MLRLALATVFMIAPGVAQASTVASALPDAELRGAAVLRFLGFPVYEARLFTRSGTSLDWSTDFAIELTYLRNLSEQELVESTMRELDRTGGALPLRDQLERCYVDVRKGDRYLAVSEGQDRVGFWLNGKRVCTLGHPQIKTRFMSIFLGDNTRSPSFTRKLKGE
ncbi:MAG: hypothetical protein WBC68_10325 [Albidovulum sp.]